MDAARLDMPAAPPAADEVVDKPVGMPPAPAAPGAGLEPLDAARPDMACGTDRGGGSVPNAGATGAAALAHRRGGVRYHFPGTPGGRRPQPEHHHPTLS